MRWLLVALALGSAGCAEKPKPAAAAPLRKPAPLEPLIAERTDSGEERDSTYQVKPFTYSGDAPPADATRLEISGTVLKLGPAEVALEALKPRLVPHRAVLLSFDAETYLAQTQELLALLDDAKVEVWLQSPDVPALAWPVRLSDEPTFGAWLEEPAAGKLRVVQRSDGFELQTNLGKLPGGDPKGPTVPLRGGALDLVTLQKGLDQVKGRFKDAPDLCFMPSFATTLHDATRAIAANWLSKEKVVYAEVCLVYPRPVPPKKP